MFSNLRQKFKDLVAKNLMHLPIDRKVIKNIWSEGIVGSQLVTLSFSQKFGELLVPN